MEIGLGCQQTEAGPVRRLIVQYEQSDFDLLVGLAVEAGLYLHLDGDTVRLVSLGGDGDPIELDVAGRRLHLDVSESDLAQRRRQWNTPEPAMESGYQRLYVERVLQADRGCDLDFLVGKRGAAVPRHSH